MKKLLIPIFLFTLTTMWPAVSQAITQTASFTLSVTLPETAGSITPQASVSSAEPATQRTVFVQTDEAFRENQVVLLESYVTK